MNQNNFRLIRPMVLVFALFNLATVFRHKLEARGIDPDVIIAGNVLLFGVSLASFILTQRSLKSSNPNAFVRAMYGSFMIKFFLCAIAAFAYIMAVKKNVNKPALFICMGLYVVYTVFEVAALTKILKRKTNA